MSHINRLKRKYLVTANPKNTCEIQGSNGSDHEELWLLWRATMQSGENDTVEKRINRLSK